MVEKKLIPLPVILLLAASIIAAGFTVVKVSSQAPPALPATVYGSVKIFCHSNESYYYAPAGLPVKAVASNGTLLASTTTGSGTNEPYQYIITIQDYEGDVEIYVGGVEVASLSVSAGGVYNVNLNVNESIPPTAPPSGYYLLNTDGSVTLYWNASTDNLGVFHYEVVVSDSQGDVLYNATVEVTNWTSPYPLEPGSYNASIYSVDLSCLKSSALVISVETDTTPPLISQYNPPRNGVTRGPIVVFNYTVIENSTLSNASLTVDSTRYTPNVTSVSPGVWMVSYKVNLSEGNHSVTVYLEDSSGNAYNETYWFLVDNTPPSIVLDEGPNETWVNTSSPGFYFTLSDSVSGVDWDSLSVSLDGSSMAFSYNESSGLLYVAASNISEGWHNLSLTVSDYAGFNTTVSIGFGVDTTPPQIEVDYPANSTVLTNSTVVVNGTINDLLSGIDESSITLSVNGTVYSVEYDNSTGVFHATLTLNDGRNVIRVGAMDKAGNRGEEVIVVRVSTGTPVVLIESPSMLVKGPEVVVSVYASDPDGLAGFKVDVDGGTVYNCSCTGHPLEKSVKINVTLGEGSHKLVVTAEDVYGFQKTMNYSFTVDNTPPTIIVFSPSNKSIVTSNALSLEAEVSDDLSGVDQGSIQVYLNGVPVNPQVSLPRVNAVLHLKPGLNTIMVSVGDRVGWSSVEKMYVVLDTDKPVLDIPEVIYLPTDRVLNIRLSDDSLPALKWGYSFQFVLSNVFSGAHLYSNGSLVLTLSKNLSLYTYYNASIEVIDPVGRTSNYTFFLVTSTREWVNTSIRTGVNLVGLPYGFIPELVEKSLKECNVSHVYMVNPDWSLTTLQNPRNGGAALVVYSTRDCHVSLEAYYTGKGDLIVELSNGPKAVLLPRSNVIINSVYDTLGAPAVIYHRDPESGRWMISYQGYTVPVGSFNILSKGEVYYYYKIEEPVQSFSAYEQGSSEAYASQQSVLPGATVLAASLIASTLLLNRRDRYKGLLTVLLLISAFTASLTASASSNLPVTPPSKVESTNGWVTLNYTLGTGEGKQTAVILDLASLNSSIEHYKITVTSGGVSQDYRVGHNGTALTILSEDLPANSTVHITVSLKLNMSSTINWRIIMQSFNNTTPLTPVVMDGHTKAVVNITATTTSSTGLETSSTTSTTSTTQSSSTETSSTGTHTATPYKTTSSFTESTETGKASNTSTIATAIIILVIISVAGYLYYSRK